MFNDVYKNLNVLVTGATGFKGAWLCAWLNQLGAKVTGYSRDIPTNPSLFEALSLDQTINHITGDILDVEHLNSVYQSVQPDMIFHLAAEPIVLESYERPRDTFMTNTMGTVNVLDLARACSSLKAMVVVTSDKCYENKETHSLKEGDPLGGSDPYSASKAAAEIAFHAYYQSFFQDSSIAVASARAGNVIGGGDWGSYRLLPDCVRAWSQNETVTIRRPQSVRPWQYVLDVLNGYLSLGQGLLSEPKIFSGESFNFSPAIEKFTALELVKLAQENWPNAQYSIVEVSDIGQSKEKEFLSLNAEKAKRLLKWSTRYDFNLTLVRTMKWYWHYYHDQQKIKQLTLDELEAFERDEIC